MEQERTLRLKLLLHKSFKDNIFELYDFYFSVPIRVSLIGTENWNGISRV